MSIQEHLDKIRNAVYGREVRESIAKGIETAYDDASENGNANMEVRLARGTHPNLRSRLEEVDNKQQQTTAQLTQKVDEVVFNTNRQTIDFLAEDRLISAIDIVEAGNSQAVQSYIDTLVSNGQIEGVTLARGSVIADNIDRIERKGNLYDYNIHFIPDYYVDTSGLIKWSTTGWSHGRVPITESGTYSVWLEGSSHYVGDIGSIGLYNGENRVDYIHYREYKLGEGTAEIGGQYKGSNYLTFTVPEGVDNIRVTNKTGGDGAFDNSETMVLVKGEEINDRVLSSGGITKLFGAPLIDTRFDENQKKPYEGKKWVVIGDSLTEINARSTKFYHEYIAEELGFNVTNMGVSGTGYKRRDDTEQAFYQRINNIPTDAEVVTIFGSLNDLDTVPHGTKDDTGTDTLGGAINTTIDNLYSILPTVPLGIISPTPWHTSKINVTGDHATAYTKLLENICHDRGIPFLDLFHTSGLRPWEESYRNLVYDKDPVGIGTHPNEVGHKLISTQIREFVKTLI